MTENKTFHMTPDDFRRYGKAVVDWIADYYERVESLPVLSQVEPGQIRASLPPQPPVQGENFETMLKDVEDLIVPGLTHWQSPNFFAFSRPTVPARRSWAICCPPGWPYRACSGPPVRPAPSWRRT
jgi:hypothetical protein